MVMAKHEYAEAGWQCHKKATSIEAGWSHCPVKPESNNRDGHGWRSGAWGCSQMNSRRVGGCLGERSSTESEQPFFTTGINPLKTCEDHTGNVNFKKDDNEEKVYTCNATIGNDIVRCATWSRRCICDAAEEDDCVASNIDATPMLETWIFEAHVDGDEVLTGDQAGNVTEKIGENYNTWQVERNTTLTLEAEKAASAYPPPPPPGGEEVEEVIFVKNAAL